MTPKLNVRLSELEYHNKRVQNFRPRRSNFLHSIYLPLHNFPPVTANYAFEERDV
jgi:hypothetical protein